MQKSVGYSLIYNINYYEIIRQAVEKEVKKDFRR